MIRAADFHRRLQRFVPEGERWAMRGKFAYRSPADWVALGVLAEGSRHRDHVYIWVASVPLFVPAEILVLSHSWRVPNGAALIAFDDEVALSQTLERAMREVPSQRKALRQIASSEAEESGYALLLLGEPRAAVRRLERPYYPDDDRPFIIEARARRALVAQTLAQGGAEPAIALLRSWRDITAAAVRVSQLRPRDPSST